LPDSLKEARQLLAEARNIAILSGAGVSAESGVPTFRGAAGLWRKFRPEDLATPEAFAHDPKTSWEWYSWRRGIVAGVQPNRGHFALAKTECTVITQNVDGLHQRAGSKNVIEVHGSIWLLRCTQCRREWEDLSPAIELMPHCKCGGLARPGVVWFGESLDPNVWAAAETAARSCDVLIVAGTSAVVYPAAGLAPIAKAEGAKIIEVNLETTSLSASVDYSFTGPSGVILPQLLDR
jgi:NAD-dependent deacetylase